MYLSIISQKNVKQGLRWSGLSWTYSGNSWQMAQHHAWRYPFHYYFSRMAQKMITKATRKRKITFKINTDQIEKTQQKPWCTWNPVYFKLISMVTFSVISDSQKLSVSPSVANCIGCAVSAKRDTESVAFPSKFFRHFAGSAALILGCVGGQRQWLAT